MQRLPAPARHSSFSSWLRARRIYILPTRACLPLLAVLLAMAYAALGQNNSVAYLLGFFLTSLAIVSMIHTHFALTRLRLRVDGEIAPVFAGKPTRVAATVENPTRRARVALEVWPHGTLWRRQRRGKLTAEPAFVAGVEARGSAAVELSLPTTQRGFFPLGRLAMSTIYPLGFFRGWFYEETSPDAGYYVYPSPAPAGARPLPEAPITDADDAALAAPALATMASPAGDDYAGARPYLPGDSQRRVDWRAAARGQGLLVKQFVGSDELERVIVWLDWHALADLDPEARLAQLCRWTLEAEARPRIWYGLRLPDNTTTDADVTEIAPGRGDAHLRRCLEALALFRRE
ncbi:MAG: DUF58 domain-containing protein [Verrucomicrobia bacterium]|nr:DUF58 domain-containing protein [Verrucomicrobiota bacterium]